jgi:hypothetical protein
MLYLESTRIFESSTSTILQPEKVPSLMNRIVGYFDSIRFDKERIKKHVIRPIFTNLPPPFFFSLPPLYPRLSLPTSLMYRASTPPPLGAKATLFDCPLKSPEASLVPEAHFVLGARGRRRRPSLPSPRQWARSCASYPLFYILLFIRVIIYMFTYINNYTYTYIYICICIE